MKQSTWYFIIGYAIGSFFGVMRLLGAAQGATARVGSAAA